MAPIISSEQLKEEVREVERAAFKWSLNFGLGAGFALILLGMIGYLGYHGIRIADDMRTSLIEMNLRSATSVAADAEHVTRDNEAKARDAALAKQMHEEHMEVKDAIKEMATAVRQLCEKTSKTGRIPGG